MHDDALGSKITIIAATKFDLNTFQRTAVKEVENVWKQKTLFALLCGET